MIGGIVIKVAFVAAILSSLGYFLSVRQKSSSLIVLARTSFHIATIGVMVATTILLYFILTHQFQYTYVWSYSSTDLSTPLLISTLWAGQEGSFTLWTLFTVIVGIILLQYVMRRGWEPEVMAVYSLILSILLLMLMVKNPFEYIWITFPNDLIQTGPIPPNLTNFVWLDRVANSWAQFPAEGKGLNPLLQNYWMVIHPPILFVGFTAMAVPYVFAVAGLMRRRYQEWIRIAKPWTVFAGAVLGGGIMLGGFWAYETLGWGGFWGWDPVENSSLIPWLVCVASIHTMMAQSRSGTFVRTNLLLSILAFVLVLYSTFLTRSGVLGETSVHSFVDAGMWAYWLLLISMTIFALLGFVLLLFRLKEIPRVPVEHSIFSREFALFLGATAIVFSAIFIVVGTSAPIISGILEGKKTAVDISFYVKTNLPLGIFIAFMVGLGQLLWWQSTKAGDVLKGLFYPALAALIFTGGLVLYGMRDFPVALFTFASALALFVNLVVGYRIFKGNPRFTGGTIAHIGIALMFLGFVSSARYDDKATVQLEKGHTVEVLDGYKLRYVGYTPTEDQKFAFNVEVEKDGKLFHIAPVMYQSEFTGGLMRNPDIVNLITKDIYVSPLSLDVPENGSKSRMTLKKGGSQIIDGLTVTFIAYDLTEASKEKMVEGSEFKIGATLEIEREGKKERLTPWMVSKGSAVDFLPVQHSLGGPKVSIARIMPDAEIPENSGVELKLQNESATPPAREETLVAEISIKPFINLVWLGTLVMVVGFIVTAMRRVRETQSGVDVA